MNRAYLLTGGNLGYREENLATANDWIRKYCGSIQKESELYETAAWGKTDQPTFLNQALALDTLLNANKLMHQILKVEKLMGRKRNEKYGPRLIDIDILLFNNEIHDDPFLIIPHPEMQNRRFALLPLAEIALEFIHPIMNKSIQELLKECPDGLPVKKFS
ncbi:MAG: 2-amino-4-hydroxy-6-hydroxymethyldihydropteridine diphosphokinase [Chitinophagaceae bacterium]